MLYMADISIKLEVIDESPTILSVVEDDLSKLRIGNDAVWVNDYPDYEGPYIIRPEAFYSVTLPTTDKHTTHDITVQEIPYSKTGNESGGFTVSIAS